MAHTYNLQGHVKLWSAGKIEIYDGHISDDQLFFTRLTSSQLCGYVDAPNARIIFPNYDSTPNTRTSLHNVMVDSKMKFYSPFGIPYSRWSIIHDDRDLIYTLRCGNDIEKFEKEVFLAKLSS